MILLVDESNRSIAEKYLAKPNPFACRILSQLLAYGTGERFLEHWVQLEDNKPRAVISRMDGNITIFCENVNDELLEFIEAVGYNTVFADKELFPQYWSGEVLMKFVGKSETEISDNIDFNPTIREIYSVLERCRGEGFEIPDFDSFYPDMSHRVRHNLSRVLAYRLEGQAIACCMTSAETDNCAIISGVACLPEYRGKGYASKLVAKIAETLGDRDIFVFCREELVGFYSRLGFSNIDIRGII